MSQDRNRLFLFQYVPNVRSEPFLPTVVCFDERTQPKPEKFSAQAVRKPGFYTTSHPSGMLSYHDRNLAFCR